jgi:hypothetical protein
VKDAGKLFPLPHLIPSPISISKIQYYCFQFAVLFAAREGKVLMGKLLVSCLGETVERWTNIFIID